MEGIVELYQGYDIVASVVTLLTLLSTVQYFDLIPQTRLLKGTLFKMLTQLVPFAVVFFLFSAVVHGDSREQRELWLQKARGRWDQYLSCVARSENV